MMMTLRSSSIRFSSSSVAMRRAPHHDVDDGGVERQRPRHLEPSAPEEATARRSLPASAGFEDLAHDLLVVDNEDGAVA